MIMAACANVMFASGGDPGYADSLEARMRELTSENRILEMRVARLEAEADSVASALDALGQRCTRTYDSLAASIAANAERADGYHAQATDRIQTVETNTGRGFHNLLMWGLVAAAVLALASAGVYWILRRRIARGADAVDAICKAQKSLAEEWAALDRQLIEVLERRMAQTHAEAAPDHSLALKVADEITRIEKNLARMSPEVKGYKPLVKAVERIKDNFHAKGYGIVTYLGQPYNEGMRVDADFVIDESLPAGTRTITAVTRPQVHFNGELLQKASITVTQNI